MKRTHLVSVPWVLALLLPVGCSQPAGMSPDLAPPPAPPYTLSPFDNARIVSQGGAPNFQHVRADIDLHDGPFAKVMMIADLSSTCYPFDQWQSDPPPAGQSWPPQCDAFDRNYEFTLDEPQAAGGPPALEVLRAITPFGGPLHTETDLTDVANGLPGKHSLTVTIPTYSDGAGKVSGANGGWNVSVKIVVTPGAAPRKVLAVQSLFNLGQGANTQPMDHALTVPAGTASARLEYRVTGHGGDSTPDAACIGPAEEFCRRTHTVFIDGQQADRFVPWRSDCTKGCTQDTDTNPFGAPYYCQQNPCGAPASVRAPRANWCPGSETPPKTWTQDDIAALAMPGPHDFTYTISKVAAGGTWRMSATYFAFGG